MTEKLISFRIEEDLKNEFDEIAKRYDITTSQLLRKFVRDTIEQHKKQNQQQRKK